MIIDQVVLDNGIVGIKLSKPGGIVIGIQYSGIDNLLEVRNKEDNRGYLVVGKYAQFLFVSI